MTGEKKGSDAKVMNRWIIVVAAIVIQLSLGAIYAWSVFTPPLSAPLPDDDYQGITEDNGITIVLDGSLQVGKVTNLTLYFTKNGEPVEALKNITVSLELRDTSDKPVKDDKVVQFVGIVYKEGKPIKAGPYTPKTAGDHLYITPKVAKAGNWHIIVNGDIWENGGSVKYDYEVLQKVKTGEYGFSISQTQLIFAVGLLTFAIFTIIGGRLSARFGPRNMAIAGGVILGAGYIIASFMGSSLIGLIFTIGILGGAGIGLGYVVPIATGVKWFPDKKGLISGLAVAGFGFGALLWVKLCTGFIFGPLELSGDWPGLYGSMEVSEVFRLYGIIFLITVVGAGLIMRNPPEGWKPKGWNPPEQTKKATGNVEFTSSQMRRTPQYWMLFFMFMVGAGSGLMVIGVIQLFGKFALMENGIPSADAVIIATTAFALFYSLANGFGRIIWGALSDKIGRKTAFIAMFALQGIMMIAFFFVGGNEYLLYLSAAIIGFNFGGNFALFPSATADFFGNKSVGLNYGWVFLSYGFGGIIGPLLGGIMGDMEYWMWAFIPAGIACLFAAVLAFLLKPPVKKEN